MPKISSLSFRTPDSILKQEIEETKKLAEFWRTKKCSNPLAKLNADRIHLVYLHHVNYLTKKLLSSPDDTLDKENNSPTLKARVCKNIEEIKSLQQNPLAMKADLNSRIEALASKLLPPPQSPAEDNYIKTKSKLDAAEKTTHDYLCILNNPLVQWGNEKLLQDSLKYYQCLNDFSKAELELHQERLNQKEAENAPLAREYLTESIEILVALRNAISEQALKRAISPRL